MDIAVDNIVVNETVDGCTEVMETAFVVDGTVDGRTVDDRTVDNLGEVVTPAFVDVVEATAVNTVVDETVDGTVNVDGRTVDDRGEVVTFVDSLVDVNGEVEEVSVNCTVVDDDRGDVTGTSVDELVVDDVVVNVGAGGILSIP